MVQSSNPADDDVIAAISGACIAYRIRLLDRAVTAIYDGALRAHGLTINQMILLVVIAGTPDVGPPEIGRRLHLEKSTLSRNLERMRARGWLETSAGRGRTTTLRVTSRGRRLLRQAHPAWSRAQRRAAQLLGEQGVRRVAHFAELVSTRVLEDT